MLSRAVGAIGLVLILTYVRVPLIPFVLAAALCGALIAARRRVSAADAHNK